MQLPSCCYCYFAHTHTTHPHTLPHTQTLFHAGHIWASWFYSSFSMLTKITAVLTRSLHPLHFPSPCLPLLFFNCNFASLLFYLISLLFLAAHNNVRTISQNVKWHAASCDWLHLLLLHQLFLLPSWAHFVASVAGQTETVNRLGLNCLWHNSQKINVSS